MAQIESTVREFLLQNPAISKSYAAGLINRRALARRIIEGTKELSRNNFEAVIAVLRRMKFEKEEAVSKKLFRDFSVVVKDGITIANLSKSRDVLAQIEKILPKISYEKNQTFKIVMGSESIKIFLDSKNRGLIEIYIQKKDIIYTKESISEISLLYPQTASEQKGILSYLATSLALHDIIIEEFLTCSPELLLYVGEKDSLKAYETLKKMQK